MRSRFEVLDAMRGVAALAVVALHLHRSLAVAEPPGSYLAVDLFFVISGFVLAEAYEQRLSEGLSVWTFLKLRLIRLYPLYLLGLTIAVAVALVDVGKAAQWNPAGLARAFAANALFLPSHGSPAGWGMPMPFVLNYPMWSLFFELAVNAAFALTARRLTTGRLVLLTLALGAAHFVVSLRLDTMNSGWQWNGFYGGFTRAGFGFFAGMLLHRAPRVALPAWSSLVLLIGVALALTAGSPAFWYGALFILGFAPAAVYIGASSRPMLPLVASFLGATSYAVYVLHEPLDGLVNRVAVREIGSRLEPYAPWSGVALVLFIVIAAWGADAFYDRPVRRWLASRLSGKRDRTGPRVALDGAEAPPF